MRQKLLDVDRLPEKCRQIFMMSALVLKWEIASRMDISENTVKTQIKLAYKIAEYKYFGEELSIFIILLLL